MNPYRAGQSEGIDKEDCQDRNKRREAPPKAPIKYPVENHDEKKRKEARKYVRDEHGAVIEAYFRLKVLIANRATVIHRERLLQTEAPRFKHLTLPTARAAQLKNVGNNVSRWPILHTQSF